MTNHEQQKIDGWKKSLVRRKENLISERNKLSEMIEEASNLKKGCETAIECVEKAIAALPVGKKQ